jgi:hypothetical protein
MKVSLLLVFLFIGCKSEKEVPAPIVVVKEWPCRDEAMLLATTAGSPDKFSCWHRLHRMRVQVATTASHEEAAALVFCQCDHPEVADAGGDAP